MACLVTDVQHEVLRALLFYPRNSSLEYPQVSRSSFQVTEIKETKEQIK